MGIESILNQLDKVKPNGNGFLACCPAHDDQNPSLSVSEGDDGRVLLNCFAGCETEAIVSALGLALSDLFPPKVAQLSTKPKSNKIAPLKQVGAIYDYQNEQGELLFQTIRFKPKQFSQRRPDGKGGWRWNLEGVRRVLYRLPELMAANPLATIFICEGEKDADLLLEHGLIATTNPLGAAKWRDEYGEFLKAREVVILPDNDKAGHEHAQTVAHSLYRVAASVRILALPGLPKKGDVSDWLNAGNSVETLCAIVDDLPEWTPETASLNDALPETVDDDLPPLFQTWAEFSAVERIRGEQIIHELERGELGMIAAVTNVGKSTLLRNMALMLACGKAFSPLTGTTKPRRVVLLDFETRAARFQSDILQMLAGFSAEERELINENLVICCDAMIEDEPLTLSNESHLRFVTMNARAFKADLLIIDTLSAAFELRDENNNAEVATRALKPMIRLARETNAAVLFSHHIGKSNSEEGRSSEKAYRARGASSFGAFSSLVLNLTPDARDPGRVVLSLAKCKGESFDDVNLKLDRPARWFKLDGAPISEPPTSYRLVIDLFADGRMMKTHEVKAALAGQVAVRTVEQCLSDAVRKGDLNMPKRGSYCKPQFPQLTIGVAEVAENDKSPVTDYEGNDLVH
jgi:hypothetical protein